MSDLLESWLHKLELRHPKAIDLGLERCSMVYRELGSPAPAPMVFTVGGTNGKGSVVAYLTAILSALDYRCGSYTSPHILQFNERVCIDGVNATSGQFVSAFEKIELARRDISLTYFEFTSLAAFQIMNEQAIDVAILEVGLGGRLDTVNLIDADCVVITPIGLDHQDYLGSDRESIGREKAGIIRAGIPVICGDRNPPSSIVTRSDELGARLLRLGTDFKRSVQDNLLHLSIGQDRFVVSLPEMKGNHQLDNLATAITAVHALMPDHLARDNKWKSAAQWVQLPGRLCAYTPDPRFLLDVGHNPMAASVVSDYLREFSQGQVICILGMLADKDATGVVEEMANVVDHWYCAGLPGSRGQNGEDLAVKVAAGDSDALKTVFENVGDAIKAAKHIAGDNDLVLVFGSFETVAAAMRVLAATAGT